MTRAGFGTLEEALDGLIERIREVRQKGPLEEVSMVRKFGPEARVAARLEISTGGIWRRGDVGVDVMGDGTLVAYSGGVRRRELTRGRDIDRAVEAIRGTLA